MNLNRRVGINMVSYIVPKRFFVGQFLWYEISEGPALIVKVLCVKQDKVEIKFLSSDETCIWVPKDRVAEVMEKAF